MDQQSEQDQQREAAASALSENIFNALRNSSEPLDSIKKTVPQTPRKQMKGGSLHDYLFHYAMTTEWFAAEFLEAYFPHWGEVLDFKKLTLLPNEQYDESGVKRIPDLIVSIPMKTDPEQETLLSLILEHKAQEGYHEDKRTLINLTQYALNETVRRLEKIEKVKKRIPQTLVALVYTGSSLNYQGPKWDDFVDPVDNVFGECAFSFKYPCINITKLYNDNELKGSPFVKMIYDALAIASLRRFDSDLTKIYGELTGLVDAKNESVLKLLWSLKTYVFLQSKAIGQEVTKEELQKMENGLNATAPLSYDFDWAQTSVDDAVDIAFTVIRTKERAEGEIKTLVEMITGYLQDQRIPVSLGCLDKIRSITDSNVLRSIFKLVTNTKDSNKIEKEVDRLLKENPDALKPLTFDVD